MVNEAFILKESSQKTHWSNWNTLRNNTENTMSWKLSAEMLGGEPSSARWRLAAGFFLECPPRLCLGRWKLLGGSWRRQPRTWRKRRKKPVSGYGWGGRTVHWGKRSTSIILFIKKIVRSYNQKHGFYILTWNSISLNLLLENEYFLHFFSFFCLFLLCLEKKHCFGTLLV